MKILVVSNDDGTWLLPAWKRFGDLNISTASIDYILLPDKIGSMNFTKSLIWSYQTFGFHQWFSLAVYSLLRRFRFRKYTAQIRNRSVTILQFDSSFILDFIKKNNIDLVVITCSYIIPQKLLFEARIPWINKHSSLLPNCRGLLPYIWSKILASRTGVTYHLVSKTIDSGEYLLQKEIRPGDSMTDFYNTIYDDFPRDLSEAIEILVKGVERKLVQHCLPESYFSLPTRADIQSFYALGGKIIVAKDFLKLFR
jgi:folate-dependent phosphoribosylglycinamide formyltransferase PurN